MFFIEKMTDRVGGNGNGNGNGKRKKTDKWCHNCGKLANNDFAYHPFYDSTVYLCTECVKLERFSINNGNSSSSDQLLTDSLLNLNSIDDDVALSKPLLADSSNSFDVKTNDIYCIDNRYNGIINEKPRIHCAYCYSADIEYCRMYGRCACGAVGMYSYCGN